MRLLHPKDPARQPLTIPGHHTLKPGLLRKLIRDAQLDVEEFRRLLRASKREARGPRRPARRRG